MLIARLAHNSIVSSVQVVMTMAEPSRSSMLENGAGHDIAQTRLTGHGERGSTGRYSPTASSLVLPWNAEAAARRDARGPVCVLSGSRPPGVARPLASVTSDPLEQGVQSCCFGR